MHAPSRRRRTATASLSQRTNKRGSVASVLFPHPVLSYQNAAGGRYTPPRRSGARILGHLAHALKARGGKYGLATLCVGVGQGVSVIVESLA